RLRPGQSERVCVRHGLRTHHDAPPCNRRHPLVLGQRSPLPAAVLVMKIPLSWLRDYVDVTLPVPQLVERLTLAGLEVSGVRILGLPVPDGLRIKPEDAGPVWE